MYHSLESSNPVMDSKELIETAPNSEVNNPGTATPVEVLYGARGGGMFSGPKLSTGPATTVCQPEPPMYGPCFSIDGFVLFKCKNTTIIK